jgi:hypothetical protein
MSEELKKPSISLPLCAIKRRIRDEGPTENHVWHHAGTPHGGDDVAQRWNFNHKEEAKRCPRVALFITSPTETSVPVPVYSSPVPLKHLSRCLFIHHQFHWNVCTSAYLFITSSTETSVPVPTYSSPVLLKHLSRCMFIHHQSHWNVCPSACLSITSSTETIVLVPVYQSSVPLKHMSQCLFSLLWTRESSLPITDKLNDSQLLKKDCLTVLVCQLSSWPPKWLSACREISFFVGFFP